MYVPIPTSARYFLPSAEASSVWMASRSEASNSGPLGKRFSRRFLTSDAVLPPIDAFSADFAFTVAMSTVFLRWTVGPPTAVSAALRWMTVAVSRPASASVRRPAMVSAGGAGGGTLTGGGSGRGDRTPAYADAGAGG